MSVSVIQFNHSSEWTFDPHCTVPTLNEHNSNVYIKLTQKQLYLTILFLTAYKKSVRLVSQKRRKTANENEKCRRVQFSFIYIDLRHNNTRLKKLHPEPTVLETRDRRTAGLKSWRDPVHIHVRLNMCEGRKPQTGAAADLPSLMSKQQKHCF